MSQSILAHAANDLQSGNARTVKITFSSGKELAELSQLQQIAADHFQARTAAGVFIHIDPAHVEAVFLN